MRAKRILLVTAGLMVAGGVFGGVAGGALTFLLLFPADGMGALLVPDLLLFGAGFGAVFGAVLGPIGAWLLMREVPLGLAVGGTTLGTIIGGAAAFISDARGTMLYAPVVGFSVAALALRIYARRRRASRIAPSANVLHA